MEQQDIVSQVRYHDRVLWGHTVPLSRKTVEPLQAQDCSRWWRDHGYHTSAEGQAAGYQWQIDWPDSVYLLGLSGLHIRNQDKISTHGLWGRPRQQVPQHFLCMAQALRPWDSYTSDSPLVFLRGGLSLPFVRVLACRCHTGHYTLREKLWETDIDGANQAERFVGLIFECALDQNCLKDFVANMIPRAGADAVGV